MISRRNLLRAGPAALLAGGMLPYGFARAAAYPSRAINLVLPAAPGTASDVLARYLMQHMSALVGQPIVVENRPGAAGVSAVNYVANASPDGYTLMVLGSGAALSQVLFKKPPYDMLRDFTMVAECARSDVAALVSNTSPLRNIQDFIRSCRERPGRVSVGIPLYGTVQHISAELLKHTQKLDYVIVPYKSSGALQVSLRAGDVDLAFDFVPPTLGQLRAGSLRPLGICSGTRMNLLPEVPTLREMGLLQTEILSSMVIAAPLRTPGPIVQDLSGALHTVLTKPDVRKGLEEMGYMPIGSTPVQARQYFEGELRKWRGVIAETNMPLQ